MALTLGVFKIEPGVPCDAFVTATGTTVPATSLKDLMPLKGQVLEIIARDAFGEETGPHALIIDYDSVNNCTDGG